jgi:23S rRNA pseudouridine2605 synthase
LMLKAHHLKQTYNLKLKTLLTFEEIESLSRATGAHIIRIKGKDAPWYEVTLSEARTDVLRTRLFQTGHAVEKVKRVAIGNLALESLAPGHHRALSDAEVATLLRSVQPSADAVTTPRRARIKRRPFTPKPKPGRKAPKPAMGAPAVENRPARAAIAAAGAQRNRRTSYPLVRDRAATNTASVPRSPRTQIKRRQQNEHSKHGPPSRPTKNR